MNLNCLRRIDSEEDVKDNVLNGENNKKPNFKMLLRKMERTWSGNLEPNLKPKPNFKKMRSRSTIGSINKPMKSPPSVQWANYGSAPSSFVADPTTPRLARSSGMRRDWSFENVGQVFHAEGGELRK